MRISPTKLLHGLLYTAPVLLLTLAACGGGGGSTPVAPVVAAYTVGGTVSGLSGSGLVLRNNGGDDKSIIADGSYTFSTSIAANSSYNVTVLTHPSSLTQRCTVANASAAMPGGPVTNADVTCVDAYTIGGSITSLTGTGLVLQNNDADNLLVPSGATTFTFSTPLIGSDSYNVTVLSDPHTPAQTCTSSSASGLVSSSVVSTVSISCASAPPSPPADPYVYAANFGSASANVSVYTSASGVLFAATAMTAGSGPSSIAVDPASQFAYVTNYNSNSISAYTITAGALAAIADVDAGTTGTQTSIATGTGPVSIAIHPSGKFAYVANYSSKTISAYSIDATTGALSAIDSDATSAQTSIATWSYPISIAIHPAGGYAYVANATTNEITVYSIDADSGAFTQIDANGLSGGIQLSILAGTLPYSVAIDPSGLYLYVANASSDNISAYNINSDGSLSVMITNPVPTGVGPHSVTVHPGGGYAYVVNTTAGTVWVYSITFGALAYQSMVPTGISPLSITIDSTGQYAYVANSGSSDISAYTITAGALAQIICGAPSVCNGNNFLAGTSPYSVTTAR